MASLVLGDSGLKVMDLPWFLLLKIMVPKRGYGEKGIREADFISFNEPDCMEENKF